MKKFVVVRIHVKCGGVVLVIQNKKNIVGIEDYKIKKLPHETQR
jgi:hypothetical protein